MQKQGKEVSERPRGGYGRGRGGQHKGGDRKQGERKPYVRRPVIRFQMDIKDIKLNEEQALKIKELDEQIKAIGKPAPLSLEEKNTKLSMFDEEITRMRHQIDLMNQRIEAIDTEKQEYLKKNAPELAERSANSQKLKEAREAKGALLKELNEVREKKTRLDTQCREKKQRSGVKSKEAAEAKIAEIEERIETTSMNSKQLKQALSEIDHLHSVMKEFDGMGSIEVQLEEAKKKEREIRDQLFAKRHEIDELEKSLEQGGNLREAIKAKTQVFITRKDAEWAKIKETRAKINDKYKEKHAYVAEFDKQWNEIKEKNEKRIELEYEKKVIYSAAERTMLQVLEGQKKVGEIKERVNPHEKEINAAASLISYLTNMLDEKEEKEEKQTSGKKVDDKTMALIASLKKPAKGGKKEPRKQAKPTTLVHSLDAMAQFAVVKITAPSKMEEIKPIVEELSKKVQEWRDQFVKAVVNFAVQADGKISVSISMA